LAKSEINKSGYYLSINANLAAISHAQKILTHYKSSNYIEDALAIEIVAYRNLGQLQLSQDTQKILLLNFPNSKYSKFTWQSDNMAWYKVFN
jgi:outer membrane protein assembly factor BamD